MEAVIATLSDLVRAQGEQIVELSKALAIAHEHHGSQITRPQDIDWERPDKLWTSEEDEDAEYDQEYGETDSGMHIGTVKDILAAAGFETPLTIAD